MWRWVCNWMKGERRTIGSVDKTWVPGKMGELQTRGTLQDGWVVAANMPR